MASVEHTAKLREAARMALGAAEIKGILQAMGERAKDGNPAAARIVLERTLGPPKDPDDYDKLPPVDQIAILRNMLSQLPEIYIRRIELAWREGMRAIGKDVPGDDPEVAPEPGSVEATVIDTAPARPSARDWRVRARKLAEANKMD